MTSLPPPPGASRPRRLVVVVGTGTEVGKTWTSDQLLRRWRRQRLQVAARKPAQSFEPGAGPTDAEVLAAASGEPADTVCPPTRHYPVPMAPPMAAARLGRPGFTLGELADGLEWPQPPVDVGLVETAGGVRSPQADDGDGVDLVRRLQPQAVLLVGDAGLGTINAVRLSLDALTHATAPGQLAVLLNRFDPAQPLHRANLDWLRRALPAQVLVAAGDDDLDRLARHLTG